MRPTLLFFLAGCALLACLLAVRPSPVASARTTEPDVFAAVVDETDDRAARAALEAQGEAWSAGMERELAEQIRDAAGDPLERALASRAGPPPAAIGDTAWRSPCSVAPGGVLECLVVARP